MIDLYTAATPNAWKVSIEHWPGIDISGLGHLKRWMDQIAVRPAVQKGIVTPPRSDPEQQVKSARSILA